jgi:hypothetical protein
MGLASAQAWAPVALRWAWTAVSWATPSAAYTSRHGVLTASEVISSGVSPVLAQR